MDVTQQENTEMSALNPVNQLMDTSVTTKLGTLATKFHNHTGEANPHVLFGYAPKTI